MYAIPLVLLLVGLLQLTTGYFFSQQREESATGVDARHLIASAQADNFLVYRAAVMRYTELNPAALGTVSNGSLPLPVGFVSTGSWTNTLTATTAYVYSSSGTEGPILSAQPNAPWLQDWIAGYNQGGIWMTNGGAGGAIPGYIPNGSVVSVIQR